MTPSARVRATQDRRRSNAAGPHRDRRPDLDEPCLCGTEFTCTALRHDDRDEDPAP